MVGRAADARHHGVLHIAAERRMRVADNHNGIPVAPVIGLGQDPLQGNAVGGEEVDGRLVHVGG